MVIPIEQALYNHGIGVGKYKIGDYILDKDLGLFYPEIFKQAVEYEHDSYKPAFFVQLRQRVICVRTSYNTSGYAKIQVYRFDGVLLIDFSLDKAFNGHVYMLSNGYVACVAGGTVEVYNSSGTLQYSVSPSSDSFEKLLIGNGYFYYCDDNSMVYKYDNNGNVITDAQIKVYSGDWKLKRMAFLTEDDQYIVACPPYDTDAGLCLVNTTDLSIAYTLNLSAAGADNGKFWTGVQDDDGNIYIYMEPSATYNSIKMYKLTPNIANEEWYLAFGDPEYVSFIGLVQNKFNEYLALRYDQSDNISFKFMTVDLVTGTHSIDSEKTYFYQVMPIGCSKNEEYVSHDFPDNGTLQEYYLSIRNRLVKVLG